MGDFQKLFAGFVQGIAVGSKTTALAAVMRFSQTHNTTIANQIMNYLAHLSLARTTPFSLTGNLMGDFMKGVKLDQLPQGIARGVDNHRAVDRFTDRHESVKALKPLFSERYRRFAGIMTDIAFDYFLTKHWQEFQDKPLDVFLDDSYQGLMQCLEYMPPRMEKTVTHMVGQDWLSGYADWGQVGFALDRVAQRIRFRNDFVGSVKELGLHYAQLEQVFLELYPQLQKHVEILQLEG